MALTDSRTMTMWGHDGMNAHKKVFLPSCLHSFWTEAAPPAAPPAAKKHSSKAKLCHVEYGASHKPSIFPNATSNSSMLGFATSECSVNPAVTVRSSCFISAVPMGISARRKAAS